MSTMREIALLKQLDKFEHPNIVRLLDICNGARPEKDHPMVLYLVFEHIEQVLYFNFYITIVLAVFYSHILSYYYICASAKHMYECET